MKKIIRKILNKINSLLLVVFAGVLIVSISLNGTTFAWFYDSAVIKANGGFQMAKLDAVCEKDNVQKLEFINFKLSDFKFAQKLLSLETKLFESRNDDKSESNSIFKDWWKDNGDTAQKSYLMPTNMVLLGNIICKEYTFTNKSDVPVYLRVKSPEVNDNQSVSVVYFVEINLKKNKNLTEIINLTENTDWIEKDGFYYFFKPMMPKDVITVEVIAYVPQLINALNLDFIGKVDIFIDHAEIIQATNNAVSFVNGWSDVADKLIPYTDLLP